MSLWKIAWRSLQQRSLASLLTAFSMALGVALVVAVLVMFSAINKTFRTSAEGFDLIIGAKGGKLQLVLNTIYHLSTPIDNVPWEYYREFTEGGRLARHVSVAIPMCMGDNYQGYRVIGTTPQFFEVEYGDGQPYRFAAGRNFQQDRFFEAVVGSLVARNTGLKVGDVFESTHGIADDRDKVHKEDAFTVVGILESTGTPNDRAVFVNLEGFLLLEGHAKPLPKSKATGPAAGNPTDNPAASADATPSVASADSSEPARATDSVSAAASPTARQPLPEAQREVTAILVRGAGYFGANQINSIVTDEPYAQAVSPVREIYQLMDTFVGPLRGLLLGLAALIVVVAAVGVMVSIYTSMNDRRRDIAVMRSLGASRRTVLAVVLLESVLLSVGGGVLGFLLGHGLTGAISPVIENRTGVSLSVMQFATVADLVPSDTAEKIPAFLRQIPCELVLLPLLVVLASIVGYVPALAAYRTDVARALSSAP